MNFSPHLPDIWTTAKLDQLYPSLAARQGSCKDVLAFCYHIQTIWSGSHQPLNQKQEGRTCSFQQVKDAAKTSALKLRSLGLPGGNLCWGAKIARVMLCHLQISQGLTHHQRSLSSKGGLTGITRGTQLPPQPAHSSEAHAACKLPFHFKLGCNRGMLRVHPSVVCS